MSSGGEERGPTQLPGTAEMLGFVVLILFVVFSERRAYGVVSMCIGTGMGAAAVFEYPGPAQQ